MPMSHSAAPAAVPAVTVATLTEALWREVDFAALEREFDHQHQALAHQLAALDDEPGPADPCPPDPGPCLLEAPQFDEGLDAHFALVAGRQCDDAARLFASEPLHAGTARDPRDTPAEAA